MSMRRRRNLRVRAAGTEKEWQKNKKEPAEQSGHTTSQSGASITNITIVQRVAFYLSFAGPQATGQMVGGCSPRNWRMRGSLRY